MNRVGLLGRHAAASEFRRRAASSSFDDSYRLTIVIPAYRAEKQIARSLDRLANFVSHLRYRTEVIVVDDGSLDRTGAAAASRQKRFDKLTVARHRTRRGIGAAARTGMLLSRGQVVILADAKLSCPLHNIVSVLEMVEQTADVAIASRRLESTQSHCDESILHRLTDTAFRALSRAVVKIHVSDSEGSLKGFRKNVGKKIAMRSQIDGDTYHVEWQALADKFGLHVVEIPVTWRSYQPGDARLKGVASGSLRDLFRIRKLLDGPYYGGATQASVHDTAFIKMKR